MNLRIDHPVGRVPDTTRPRSKTLHLTPDGWSLGRYRGRWIGSLHDALGVLDTEHGLTISGVASSSAADEIATFIVRAIARGTFVSGLVDPEVRKALPPELNDCIGAITPTSVPGDLDWDVRAVEQRRTALRPLVTQLPKVSVILVSRRPRLVDQMVQAMAAQNYPDLEIVVGLHGVEASPGLSDMAIDREISVYEFPADDVYGSVLDQTTARASGDLVTKIDDDDHYGPDHLWDLVASHRYSGATMVGKSTTVVYLEALDTTVRRLHGVREIFTHRVAGSTILLQPDDLRSVGGWPHVPRAVDTALINALRAHGGTIYQPHDIGYLYVRKKDAGSHTWSSADTGHFLRNTREQWIGLLQHPAFGTG